MKKISFLLILLSLPICVFGVSSSSSINWISQDYADYYLCRQNGNCVINNLNVTGKKTIINTTEIYMNKTNTTTLTCKNGDSTVYLCGDYGREYYDRHIMILDGAIMNWDTTNRINTSGVDMNISSYGDIIIDAGSMTYVYPSLNVANDITTIEYFGTNAFLSVVGLGATTIDDNDITANLLNDDFDIINTDPLTGGININDMCDFNRNKGYVDCSYPMTNEEYLNASYINVAENISISKTMLLYEGGGTSKIRHANKDIFKFDGSTGILGDTSYSLLWLQGQQMYFEGSGKLNLDLTTDTPTLTSDNDYIYLQSNAITDTLNVTKGIINLSQSSSYINFGTGTFDSLFYGCKAPNCYVAYNSGGTNIGSLAFGSNYYVFTANVPLIFNTNGKGITFNSIGLGNITFSTSRDISFGYPGQSVQNVDFWSNLKFGYRNAGYTYTPTWIINKTTLTQKDFIFNNQTTNEVFRIKQNGDLAFSGNISWTAPNGTIYDCGINNSGTFLCSFP